METKTANPSYLPAATLLADYYYWLEFLATSRQTIRRYERRLVESREVYPYLNPLSSYLLTCMSHRHQFIERVAKLIDFFVNKLRGESTDKQLVGRLSRVHPMMQSLMEQIKKVMAEVEESYQNF